MARAAAVWTASIFRYSDNSQRRHCRACCSKGTPSDWAIPGLNIGEPVEGSLLYKPYLEYLCRALSTYASGLQQLPLEDGLTFKSRTKSKRPAKVYNFVYESERLRRVRITYFDAGKSFQAFNALLYPNCRFELPMLGIDLLSFGSSKILCVVDFIPLFQEPEYAQKYISHLASVRQAFSSSCSQMSDRFFDKDLFASEQMVFFKSDLGPADPALEVPEGDFYSVYTRYVDIHLELLHSVTATEETEASRVRQQQNAYDQYLADRDPAFKVFSSYFSKEWTQRFCAHFLCPGAQIF